RKPRGIQECTLMPRPGLTVNGVGPASPRAGVPDPVGRSRDAWSPYPAGGFAAPAATNRGVSVPRFTVQHDDRDDTIPAAWTHKGAPRPLLILADALAHKAVARFKRGRQATED